MILVTGGTGVMGSRLVKGLAQKGSAVRVLTLPGDKNVFRVKAFTDDIRFGDISSKEDVKGICEGVDTVYHCAAVIIGKKNVLETVNIEGTSNVVEEASRACVRHFVHISSASVVYPKPTEYSLTKRKGEEIVRGSGLEWTIIRPTLVYDESGGEEFNRYCGFLKKAPVVPFAGNGSSVKRPVFAGDIIDGLINVYKNKNVFGKTYNFSGSEALTMNDFARLCLRLMGAPDKFFVHIPVPLCLMVSSLASIFMKNKHFAWQIIAGLTQDADINPEEAVRDLGYNPSPVSRKLGECFPRAGQPGKSQVS